MNMKRGAKLVALLSVSAIALSACATGGKNDKASGSGSKNRAITVAWEKEPNAYNNSTGTTNSVQNTVTLNQILRGFVFTDPEGQTARDTEFGEFTAKLDPANPVVEYKFNEKAVWSDGEAIDCDDAVLNWAAYSGKFKTGEKDKDGKDVSAFDPAGTTGYKDMEMPDCKAGDKSFKVKYTTPYADWDTTFGSFMPAHIVSKKTGVDVLKAIQEKNTADIAKVGKFWSEGFKFGGAGQLDKEAMPSAGPYMYESYEPKQNMTLVANPKWWGTKPKSDKIVFRFIASDQQAAPLQNGEVDVVQPSPQADIVTALKNIGERVKVTGKSTYTYEHLTFNFASPVFKDKAVREALAMCVPRQTIVDNLIKPVDEKAEIFNLRLTFPFQETYAANVNAEVKAKYDKVNIEESKKLLASAAPASKTVRLFFQSPNPRREAQARLIADSCKQAGFDIQVNADKDFFKTTLSSKDAWDLAMFAWSGSASVTGQGDTFGPDGENNKGSYSNPQVDALCKQLDAEMDRTKQPALLKQIDDLLWADMAQMPLYAWPGIVASRTDVDGVVFQRGGSQITWNIHQWERR